MTVLDIAAGVLVALTVYLYFRSRSHVGHSLPLPPGPRKLPIIGNALDMPTEYASKGYAEMCKKYNSDIIHLNVLGTNLIVLNSYDAAQELLEKRSSIYSSRPSSVMLRELGGYAYVFVGIPYNALWKTHRRLFSKYFHPQNTEISEPKEIEHVHVLLGKLLHSPEEFMSHTRHMVASISLSEVYGLKIKSKDDPYINLSETALETLEEMVTPGAFLVETFPLLKYIPEWFPGTRFHQVARKARKESKQVLNVPYNASITAMNNGTILPSFMYAGLTDMQNMSNVDQSQHVQTLKEIGVMTYLGGMDTTNAALDIFILTMVLFPDVQKTAQRELDKVVDGRLPNHSDMPFIPYMMAMLLELLRWETPVAAGFVHCNTEDDIFKGYYIPKDSIIIPNQRAMLHNEQDYPDPHLFKPERFLKDGKLNDEIKNPEDIAFGFGRRKCPGSHLAKSSLWLAMASVLSTFNIEKVVDNDGNIVEPNYKFSGTTVNHLEPFPCSITPRSKKAILLINSVSEPYDEVISREMI
ncbi:cytochrome P450 [Cyathus striatus]|nr:cytochrome P450 [Cyathus striatus]